MKNNLIILIPAYNEEKTVDLLLNGWSRVLSSLSIDYKIMIFDDGSTDATRERVLALKKMDDNIILLPLKHCGYNKTINTIYNYSLDTEWIFQADFDDEIMPDEFLKLWKLKDDVDAVLGVRLHRQNLLRTVVSSFASFWIKFLSIFSIPIDLSSLLILIGNNQNIMFLIYSIIRILRLLSILFAKRKFALNE